MEQKQLEIEQKQLEGGKCLNTFKSHSLSMSDFSEIPVATLSFHATIMKLHW